MDRDGYPTEDELEKVRTWDVRDPMGWFAYVKECWAYPNYWDEDAIDDDHGFMGRGPYTRLRISTAGWSVNESLIAAMQQNHVLWSLTWYSARRGGHFEFRARHL